MVRTVAKDKHEQKVLDDIARVGWHCVAIMPEENLPGYAFTIGLFHRYNHPELIIFGLPQEIAHRVLTIAADAAKSGAPIDLTQPCDAFLKGYSCCFVEVPSRSTTSMWASAVGITKAMDFRSTKSSGHPATVFFHGNRSRPGLPRCSPCLVATARAAGAPAKFEYSFKLCSLMLRPKRVQATLSALPKRAE
jgi:hypothetical protein